MSRSYECKNMYKAVKSLEGNIVCWIQWIKFFTFIYKIAWNIIIRAFQKHWDVQLGY